jgi:DNA-binding NarL/FixJ family response regulator
MREMSVAEQRYQAVLAVIADGRSVTEVAGQWRVSRQTL